MSAQTWPIPTLTADEARLLIDHLDNVQAASLDDDDWRAWRRAKDKLLVMELAAKP